MLMHPVSGLLRLARASRSGLQPIDWFADAPLTADHPHRRLAVAALRHADPADGAAVARRGAEGSGRDGRHAAALRSSSTSRCRISPAPITVVILIETIFLLTVFAEIFVTTGGGGRDHQHRRSSSMPRRLLQFDVGGASAGGIVAVILANIVAFFLVRMIGKNLEALRPWPARVSAPAQDRHDGRCLGGRIPDLLPDPLDDPHQLQDRARGVLDAAEVPVLRLDDWRTTPSSRSGRTICSFADELGHPVARLDAPRPAHRHPGRLGDGLLRRASAPRIS